MIPWGFFAMSTLVGYLLPNPIYSYTLYMICKYILAIKYLNKPGVIFWHRLNGFKYFNQTLKILFSFVCQIVSSNSIKHETFLFSFWPMVSCISIKHEKFYFPFFAHWFQVFLSNMKNSIFFCLPNVKWFYVFLCNRNISHFLHTF